MEQEKGSRLEDMIIEELYSKEDKEAFERAVSLCIAIEFGLIKMNSLRNKAAADMMDSVDEQYYESGTDYSGRTCQYSIGTSDYDSA